MKKNKMGIILCSRLRKIREEKRMTQFNLSIKSGVSYDTIRKMEGGHIQDPSFLKVIKIMNTLGVSIEDLYYPNDPSENPPYIIKNAIS